MNTKTRIVTIFGAKGGTGRSVLAANLAVAMAQLSKKPVALVDLDWLTGGSLASYLDLEPIQSHWWEWAEGGKGLADVLHAHASGVNLVPPAPAGTAVLSPDQLVELLNQLSQNHPTIVIDTCWPHISPLMLPLFDLASCVITTCTPDITTLQATKELLDKARDLHFPSDR
ncbi:MAG TPA: P-loop NTPase, partial [Oscillatoriaceae cyanobacterium]